MPGDGLSLTVLIRCQIEFVGVLEQTLELGDLLLLARVDAVVGIEAVVDVDGELAVGPLLHIGGQFRGSRQVADMTDGGLDVITIAEVSHNRSRLRRRLDDDEATGFLLGCGHAFTFLSRHLLHTATDDPGQCNTVDWARYSSGRSTRTRHQRFTILSLFPAGPGHLGVSGGAAGQQHAGRGQGSDLGDELVFQGCGIHVEQLGQSPCRLADGQ